MFILGNCEIVVEDDKLDVKIGAKQKTFSGTMKEQSWKIETVSVYCPK